MPGATASARGTRPELPPRRRSGQPAGRSGQPADRPEQVVYAVRTNPPPEVAELPQGLLWWRRVDQLDMPVDTFRAVMHRVGEDAGVEDLDEPADGRRPAGVLVDALHLCHRSRIGGTRQR